MIRIVSTPNTHRDGTPVWSVLADWHGAERAIYSGSVFDCAQYAATIQEFALAPFGAKPRNELSA